MSGVVSDDEQALRLLVLQEGYGTPANTMPRYLARRLDIPGKRADFLFGKWDSKGWYEYGTVVDGGWLTEKGQEEFAKGSVLNLSCSDSSKEGGS